MSEPRTITILLTPKMALMLDLAMAAETERRDMALARREKTGPHDDHCGHGCDLDPAELPPLKAETLAMMALHDGLAAMVASKIQPRHAAPALFGLD